MTKNWAIIGGGHFLSDTTSTISKLENVVYNLGMDPKMGFFLQKLCDKFTFGYKIYGLEEQFINRTIKTYNNTSGNMGILLTGVKGTGKTVTAEIIANKLNQPVINISQNYKGLNAFLAQIEQDFIVLIDEYDKVFKGNIEFDDEYEAENQQNADSSLLSIMDGSYNNQYRKVFILTTNKMWVNENLLNRPGRIRYKKKFADLSLDQINEIIDDCLVEKEYRGEIVAFLKPLKLITVDIVKAVISQVNIFNESPEHCCTDLNVEVKEDEWKAYKVDEGKEELFDEDPASSYITAALNPALAWRNRQLYLDGVTYYIKKKPNYMEKTFVVSETHSDVGDTMVIKIKKHQPMHSVFHAF